MKLELNSLLRAARMAAIAVYCSVSVSVAAEGDGRTFKQRPEIAPSAARGEGLTPSKPALQTASVDSKFVAGGEIPQWIWGADDNQRYFLRIEFAGGSKTAVLRATCDNAMTVWINGKQVAASEEWQSPVAVDVQKHVIDGKNVLLVEAANAGGVAGFVAQLTLTMADGSMRHVVTDDSWRVADRKDAADWQKPRLLGKLGRQPWGNALDKPAANVDNVVRDVFQTLPGFQVERLFTVPKEELGSWVAIAFDNKGRLIVSDEGKRGLCRVTPPAIGSDGPTGVERIDLNVSGAQGILYAFDSLYLCVNGGPGSGLYRAKDHNGDDKYDELTKLKAIRGGGEHGPHAIRLSPDGKSIFLLAGNHTQPPFESLRNAPPQTMGGSRTEQLRVTLPAGATSRLMPNWDEDLLLPRQWDANGHAAGILAPGGWIAKTDPEGKTWEMFSIGYRNQYDMAFNADGELFSYDSDMEWDMGMPWYRPTRVVHATAGSEFGWRSGTGVWPNHYPDSLPPLIEIGPGSPVGVEFGYGAKFPAKYQKALFICDWTFGTMYAIHMEPQGASYKATKEEFLSRTPLPLTDVAVGPDGALYFTIGGRGTGSELFRVTYVGKESTAPAELHESRFAADRELRQEIERTQRSSDDAKATVIDLTRRLGHEDRRLRYAARTSLEQIDTKLWQEQVLSLKEPDAVIAGVIGLARQAEPSEQPKLLAALDKLEFASLTASQQLDALRAWSLTFIRLGAPPKPIADALAVELDKFYPAASGESRDVLNRELCNLLVYLKSPKVVAKTIALMKQPTDFSPNQMAELLARNANYGGTINAMLANRPETQKIHYAFALRNASSGWTPAERVYYFQWLSEQTKKQGGASYVGFVKNIDKDAYENATDVDRLAVEAAGARTPYKSPELPKAQGPGKEHSLSELLALSSTHMQGRNFENGKKMYSAARCVVCHRFQGDGGATGPDLTQLAGRFNFKDLSEAIVDPGKIVSDLYRTTVIQTEQGKAYTGRVVSVTDDSLSLLIDPEDASKIVQIKKADIAEQQQSPVSLMPKDLLKQLNQDEVLDLLAYLLSRGNPKDPMFSK